MANRSSRRIRVFMRLPADLIESVDQLADYQGITRTAVIEDAVRQAVLQDGQVMRVFASPVFRDAMFSAIGRPEVIRGIAAAMGEDLNPDQLELFQRSVQAMRHAAELPAPLRPGVQPGKRVRKTKR